MVNKIVFDYLSNYHGKYNLNDLKKKILSAGYSQQDIDEAIRLLGLEESSVVLKPSSINNAETNVKPVILNNKVVTPTQTNVVSSTNNLGVVDFSKQVQPVNYDNFKPSGKKFKWMKLAGIIGVLYLLLGILLSIAFYFLGNSLNENSSIGYVLIGIFFIEFISIFFFIYGFVKMGWYADSRLLRFAAKSFMVLIILSILAVIGMVVFAISMAGTFATEINALTSELAGNLYTPGLIFGSIGDFIVGYVMFFIVALVVVGLLNLFAIIVSFCFFIGLTQVGREVRFAKAAGVLGILNLIMIFVFPLALLGMGILAPGVIPVNILSIIIFAIAGVLGLLGFLIYLFMVFSLFSASRKFESGYV